MKKKCWELKAKEKRSNILLNGDGERSREESDEVSKLTTEVNQLKGVIATHTNRITDEHCYSEK